MALKLEYLLSESYYGIIARKWVLPGLSPTFKEPKCVENIQRDAHFTPQMFPIWASDLLFPLMALQLGYPLPESYHGIIAKKWVLPGLSPTLRPGHIAQSVTCLATDASLTANPGFDPRSGPILSWRLIMK